MYINVNHTNWESIQNTLKAGVFGLVKTASIEWENTYVKGIGIENPDLNQDLLATEIYNEMVYGDLSSEVFLDDQVKRYTLETVFTTANKNSEKSLSNNDVVLVSGGAKGVTSDCIVELAKIHPVNFALLGRTPISDEPEELMHAKDEVSLKTAVIKQKQVLGEPVVLNEIGREVNKVLSNREIKTTISRLKDLGANVMYYPVDVTNKEEVYNLTRNVIKDLGPITGLIHGAGVLADRLIVDKTDDQFLRVFDTKVKGFLNLLEATEDQALTHICCFSSVAGRFGNKGQVDYSMANEVLNKMSIYLQQKKGNQCIVKSLNWGPWDGGMVTEGLKAHFLNLGIEPIDREQGATAFVQEFLSNENTTEVVLGNGLENWRNLLPQKESFKLLVNEISLPIIADHIIEGVPVMPMASIVKKAHDLVSAKFGFDAYIQIKNLQVTNALKLVNYFEKGDWISFQVNKLDADKLEIEVKEANEKLNYKFEVHSLTSIAIPDRQIVVNAEAWNWNSRIIYKEKLFHTGSFKVIKGTIDFSESGGSCLLKKLPDQNLAYVQILDAALQLSVLWVSKIYGIDSLPMTFESLNQFEPIQKNTNYQCQLIISRTSNLETVADVQIIDEKQKIVVMDLNKLKVFAYKLA